MGLRIAFLLIIVPFFLGALATFDAASRTALALDILANVGNSESRVVQTRLLREAEGTLVRSWSKPTLWHAGASEALSSVYFQRAFLDGDPTLYRQSAELAVRTVNLAPVQPRAWIRLAALAELGHASSICNIQSCLERSWSVAPMIDGESECTRLRIAYRHGILRADDARLAAYVRRGVNRNEAAACLSFLPPQELFRLLLLRRQR